MNRREFILATSGAVVGGASLSQVSGALGDESNRLFGRHNVVQKARELSAKQYVPPPEVPDVFGKLGYDQYRDIRFREDAGIWLSQERGFTLEFLHAGFIYKNPVSIHLVEDGVATALSYNPNLFDFGPLQLESKAGQQLFSGIRLRTPIHTPGRSDEFIVFQGASYFRSIGAGQIYGASARGLAIDTAEPEGEEFPNFRSFWIERPQKGAKTILVHALLDSPSVAGAYSFRITPGISTLMEVDATLFARNDLANLGVAPLTGMYMFASIEGSRFPDFRHAVHDCDVLCIFRRNGDWVARSLSNPKTLQVSGFTEYGVRGYGLQQRARKYRDFKDLEARYELRPSVWVEPRTDWGEGQIELVEIPTDREFNDNIVAFWRPRKPLKRGQSQSYEYWLHWGPPIVEKNIATVQEVRGGLTLDRERQLFVVDFLPPSSTDKSLVDVFRDIEPQVSASKGDLHNIVGRLNFATGGYRVSFELDVDGVELSELRLLLVQGRERIGEAWLYRWTA